MLSSSPLLVDSEKKLALWEKPLHYVYLSYIPQEILHNPNFIFESTIR